MVMEIPIEGGAINAHHEFDVTLGDNFLTMQLNYLSTDQWALDIYRDGSVLVAGAMLNVNADIIGAWGLQDDIGVLTMTGVDVTLDNLGIENHLLWQAPDESV